jgi:hypothetical protein
MKPEDGFESWLEKCMKETMTFIYSLFIYLFIWVNFWITLVRTMIFFVTKGPRTTALRLFVQPQWRWWGWTVFFFQFLQWMEHQWKEIDRGKPTTRRKTCPSATLSTTNLTWTWPGIEPRDSVVRGQRLTAWAMARPIRRFTIDKKLLFLHLLAAYPACLYRCTHLTAAIGWC